MISTCLTTEIDNETGAKAVSASSISERVDDYLSEANAKDVVTAEDLNLGEGVWTAIEDEARKSGLTLAKQPHIAIEALAAAIRKVRNDETMNGSIPLSAYILSKKLRDSDNPEIVALGRLIAPKFKVRKADVVASAAVILVGLLVILMIIRFAISQPAQGDATEPEATVSEDVAAIAEDQDSAEPANAQLEKSAEAPSVEGSDNTVLGGGSPDNSSSYGSSGDYSSDPNAGKTWHEAITHQEWVVTRAVWTEQMPVYGTVEHLLTVRPVGTDVSLENGK